VTVVSGIESNRVDVDYVNVGWVWVWVYTGQGKPTNGSMGEHGACYLQLDRAGFRSICAAHLYLVGDLQRREIPNGHGRVPIE